MASILLNLLRSALWSSFCLSWTMLYVCLKEYEFCHCGVECSVIFTQVKMVDNTVKVIYILADFVSSFISVTESGILTSTVIIELLISLFNYFHFFFFLYFGTLQLTFTTVLQHPEELSPVTHFVLKSILFDSNIILQLSFDYMHGISFSILLLSTYLTL